MSDKGRTSGGMSWHTGRTLWRELKPAAREMRHEPNDAEQVLWNRLRNRQVAGTKFRRQHSLGRFIVDFYSAEAGLVIEVDGLIHESSRESDAERDLVLESLGLTVIGFRNEDVLNSLEAVIARIASAARA